MTDTDFAELVRSNIQDVLKSVAQDGCQIVSVDHEQWQQPEANGSDTNQPAVGATTQPAFEVPSNSEATIRLLRARMKSLEEQLNTAMTLNQGKDAELVQMQKQIKLATQKETTNSKSTKALEAQVERHRKAAEAAREALAAKEQQLKELSKQAGKADKDKHLVEQESRTRDVRLQRALEEVERYKELLQNMKMQGQEVKDVARSEHSKALSEVRRLERQKGELMVVLRKQAKLIDVLRRQRAHLEAARLLAFTEDEFMRTLDTGA